MFVQPDMCRSWSEPPKTDFVVTRFIFAYDEAFIFGTKTMIFSSHIRSIATRMPVRRHLPPTVCQLRKLFKKTRQRIVRKREITVL